MTNHCVQTSQTFFGDCFFCGGELKSSSSQHAQPWLTTDVTEWWQSNDAGIRDPWQSCLRETGLCVWCDMSQPLIPEQGSSQQHSGWMWKPKREMASKTLSVHTCTHNHVDTHACTRVHRNAYMPLTHITHIHTRMHICTHKHMHEAHTCTCNHEDIHAHTHVHRNAHTFLTHITHLFTHSHTHMHIYAYKRIHAEQSYTDIFTHHIHTHLHTFGYKCMHVCVHTCI